MASPDSDEKHNFQVFKNFGAELNDLFNTDLKETLATLLKFYRRTFVKSSIFSELRDFSSSIKSRKFEKTQNFRNF